MTATRIHLNGHHRKTLAAIFQHPLSHNLEWHDVLSLIDHVGGTSTRDGGGHDLTIGEDRLFLGPVHDHDLTGEQVRDLRAFLTRAGLAPDADAGLTPDDTPAEAPAPAALDHIEPHCIVLIDHHHARLFGLGGASCDATTAQTFTPDDDDGSKRRIEHKQQNDDHDGGHAGEEAAYYEHVAIALKPARRIVVLSDGKGRSNAGAYLVDYLMRHHPAIAGRIVATDRVDIAHLSDGEIVAAGTALLSAG